MQFGAYIDQRAVVAAGLDGETDLIDWWIVEYMRSWWTRRRARSIDRGGQRYTWISLGHLINENPLLPFGAKSGVARRIAKLRRLRVLDAIRGPGGRLYFKAGPRLVDVDEARGKPCGEAVDNSGARCGSATPPVAVAQHEQLDKGAEDERGRARAPRIMAPSSPTTARAAPSARAPVTLLYEFLLDQIRAHAPSYVDLRPRASLGAIAARARTLGAALEPHATPDDQAAAGVARLRQLVAYVFGARCRRTEMWRWLKSSGLTATKIISAHVLETAAQGADAREPKPHWQIVGDEWRAAQATPVPKTRMPEEARKKWIGRRRTAT